MMAFYNCCCHSVSSIFIYTPIETDLIWFALADTVPLDVYIAPYVGMAFDDSSNGRLDSEACSADDAHYGTFTGVDWAVGIGHLGIHLGQVTLLYLELPQQ